MQLIFATRPSKLARWQTSHAIQALQHAWPELTCKEEVITTQGDRILDRPLPEIGGKGLFTQDLEAELLPGRVHAAVHSLKDLPTENPPDLTVGAIMERAEVRDGLISAEGYTLETLPQGARLGTSSLRRAAQVLAVRPDLQVEPLRGNVDTRLRKAQEGQYDAIILAGAGLVRLGLAEYVSQWLPLEIMLPAPGQGALAVQCRLDDAETLRLLGELHDSHTYLTTTAERAFLAGLGGGCSVPVAAYGIVQGEEVLLRGLVAAIDGKSVIRVQEQGIDPHEVGQQAAAAALSQGAGVILNV